MISLNINSSARIQMIDITADVTRAIRDAGWKDGAAHLYCQHTTCGLTINEGADPDVRRDLERFFQEIAPHNHGWRHAEGNTDAHILSSLLGVSLVIPIADGALCLGMWQHIYLHEGDGPRGRRVLMQRLCI